MKYLKKITLGRLKISLAIGLVTKVQGVNSNLRNGQHMLMWEFDVTDFPKVRQWLWATQVFYGLPSIHIVRSHPGGGFHAYCWTSLNWIETINVVSGTYGVDPGYISMCAMRGHWTLRLTDKGQGAPDFLETLPGAYPDTSSPADLTSWVKYETWAKSQKTETRMGVKV